MIPPLAVSTPAAYRAWDDLGGPTATHTGGDVNDLEAAAVVVEPRLATWKARIAELAGVQPTLAGSGATWFIEGEREKALADLVDEGASVLVTSTVDAATVGSRTTRVVTCDAGGACGGASSCAFSCACAYGAF